MRLTHRSYLILFTAVAFAAPPQADAKPKRQNPDWAQTFVPEEGGSSFERITTDNDCVNWLLTGKRKEKYYGDKSKADLTRMDWWINPQLAISPDGSKIAYLNYKNNTSNIMVKDATQGGASVQRTFRTGVTDFTWSPDGKELCFTENRGGHMGIYLVDASVGNVVHQISTGTDDDYGGVMSRDCRTIYFHRGEGMSSYSIWSYDRDKNLFSNYSRGMTPVPDPTDPDILYCSRFTDKKECEIWRINTRTGTEEIILAQPGRCFSTPQISPDGRWILVTGSGISEKEGLVNTDLYVVRTDGTKFTQLTYHPGNDLSGVWSPDGTSIYFLSQRGSANKVYNIWKMSFPFYSYTPPTSRYSSETGTTVTNNTQQTTSSYSSTKTTNSNSNTKRKTRR